MIDLRLKYGTNNIPILSNETIDEHAERLIGDYDSGLLSKPQAIDVEDFAENYLGLHFHFTDLSHNGFIWGRMVFNDAKIIVYNPETHPICTHLCSSFQAIVNQLVDTIQYTRSKSVCQALS